MLGSDANVISQDGATGGEKAGKSGWAVLAGGSDYFQVIRQ
jgi:hypothetical protein